MLAKEQINTIRENNINEASLLLELPRTKLTRIMEQAPFLEDPFNKALAIIRSRKLRSLDKKFFDVKNEGIATNLKYDIFQKTLETIDSYKKTILQIDKDLNKNGCTSEEAFQHLFSE